MGSICDRWTPAAPFVQARVTRTSRTADPVIPARHFGDGDGLLPLWIAEPFLELSQEITAGTGSRPVAG